MDLAIKDAYTLNVGKVAADLTDGDTAITLQTLHNQKLALENELRSAMNDGKINEVVRIQSMLGSLPVQIKTAEISEIKSKISSGNNRLDEIKEDFMEATRIRNQKHQIYLDKVKIMEAAGTDVLKVDFILTTLDNESESIRRARREYNERLNKLMTDADA